MIKYLVFILVVLFSQIRGEVIIHTETYDRGNIKLISYHKEVVKKGVLRIIKVKDIEYYINGIKKFEYNYKNGTLDGLTTEWFENGQKSFEGTLKDGYEDGLLTRYYENGQKSFEGTYKNGKFISGKYWNEDGSVKE